MSKQIWGNITWKLFHSLTINIKDDIDVTQIQECIKLIKNICNNLPCPQCARDATQLLKKSNISQIKTKAEFKQFMYIFHNKVNVKLKKKVIDYSEIDELHTASLNSILNDFFKVYSNLKHPSAMMLNSFHRHLIINQMRQYFISNIELYRLN